MKKEKISSKLCYLMWSLMLPAICIAGESAWDKLKAHIDFANAIWGFATIIGSIVIGVFSFCKRKAIRKIWFAILDFFHGKYAIQDISNGKLTITDLLPELRKKVQVLVIDDNMIAREQMVSQLKGLGYTSTRGHFPITLTDGEVKESHIFVVDINNVYFGPSVPPGSENQGLQVAQAIKCTYPIKKILSYTGNLDDYKGNVILENVVDGKFEKGENQGVVLSAIDGCVRGLFEPDKFWTQIRTDLLLRGERTIDVAELEDAFVKTFIREQSLTLDVISNALEKISKRSTLAQSLSKIVGAMR